MLWENPHLLFGLSPLPFATGWMGENHFANGPSARHGAVLFMAALAYWLLQRAIIAVQGHRSRLARAVGSDWRGKLSPPLQGLAVAISLWHAWMAQAIYAIAALIWLVPNRRIKKEMIDAAHD